MRPSSVSAWLLAGALILFVASPTAAQETGTLRPHRAAQMEGRSPNAARVTMEAFGACIVSRSRARVAKFVNMPVDDPGYRKYLGVLFDSMDEQCLSGGELSFYDVIFRGALFQALYKSEFKNDGPVDLAAVGSTGYREIYGPELSPAARSSVAMVRFGECVARADGTNLKALLRALPGSASETALFGRLTPRFGTCIPKGEKIEFSKVVLKGALAEGMYRLSKQATAIAGTGAGR